MWREAATELGAELEELGPWLYELRLDGKTVRVQGQTTPLANPVAIGIGEDKPLAYRLLAAAGVPVPRHAVVDAADRRAAEAFLRETGAPVLVKPARGAGGDGVTGQVRTPDQLGRALVRAGRFHPEVMVERQAEGDSYRVLVLDGEVLDVLRRPRPTVTGDGRSTIEELVFAEYARRIRDEGFGGLKHFAVDFDCLFTLEAEGLGLGSVPPAGERVVVKTATNYNGPGENEPLPEPFPGTLVDVARRAAAELAVRLGGVDVVTAEPSRPLEETGGVVLEDNPVPGLWHHYNVADGPAGRRVAVPILRRLFDA
jgi:cyanophycin synthetase